LLRFFQSGRTRVKFCGLTREEDVVCAAQLGVDALGFNLFAGSKRYLPLPQAVALAGKVPDDIARIAVVVNPEPQLLAGLQESGCFDVIQFHGHETPEFCRSSHWDLQIKALPADADPSDYDMPWILLDTPSGAGFGGSGLTFDWALAAAARRAHPTKQLILAGGLQPANVADAIVQVRPHAVDVAGGIESAPGQKDPGKMHEFMAAVRLADD